MVDITNQAKTATERNPLVRLFRIEALLNAFEEKSVSGLMLLRHETGVNVPWFSLFCYESKPV